MAGGWAREGAADDLIAQSEASLADDLARLRARGGIGRRGSGDSRLT